MGLVVRESIDGGGKKVATICDLVQQGVNTATADLTVLPDAPPKSYAVEMGSNLAATARTLTKRYDQRSRSLVVGGLEGTGVGITCNGTQNSDRITSAAAFSLTQHEGAGITGTGVPADTYILKVIDTSNAILSKPYTGATGAIASATLWDRLIVTLFH